MVDLSTVSFFVYFLDLFGTMAFAVTGAFKAIEHKADIVGIIILSTITGVAGGTIRDMIFEKSLPNSITDPAYVITSVSTAVIVFLLHSKLKPHWNTFLKFDAIGLGVFTIIGASFAYEIFGMNFLAITLAGMITAVGGSVLRDILVNETPLVITKELYATASFLGILVFYFSLVFFELYVATILGILFTIGLRMIAMKFNWNLPKVQKN